MIPYLYKTRMGASGRDDSLLCSLAVHDAQILTGAAPFARSDTASEKAMLERYFRGEGGSYSLSPTERAAALAYIQNNIGDGRVVGPPRGDPRGHHWRYVNFAYWDPLTDNWGEPQVDGLLGSARVDFEGNRPVGIRDSYDFEPGNRGQAVETVASYLRNSARAFCRNPTPIRIDSRF